ncbi:MAG: ATP synthase F1 subunit delta [Gemmataceae bacterium]
MDATDSPQEFTHVISLDEQRVAKVYAEALFKAAEADNSVDQVKDEFAALVHDVFQQQPQFEEFLASAAIDLSAKKRVLQNTFQNRSHPLVYNFLQVLAERDRLPLLRAVYEALVDLQNKRMRRIPVRVESAVPLSDDQKGRLANDLREGFQLEPMLEEVVKPELLGGLILQVADFVFDASVRGEIEKIRKHVKSRSSYGIEQIRDRIFPTDG